MKAFITGISGFVGKHLEEHLVAHGYEVKGIDRAGESSHAVKCDILDAKMLREIVAQFRPDVIFHLAAISSVPHSFENPDATMRVNVEGTRNLFEAIVQEHLTPTILVVSSLQVYGQSPKLPITEDSPLNPVSPYAQSKVEQERLCGEYEKKGLRIIVSRSFNHTGPGQTEDFVIPSFAKQVAMIERGEAKEVKVGNLEIERDFTDVRDVVEAYRLAVERAPPGVYNICRGSPTKLARIIEILKQNSPVDIKVVVDEQRLRSKDALTLYGNHDKFSHVTGWQPIIPIEKTVKDVLNSMR